VNFKDSGTTISGCAAVPLGTALTAACSTSALVAGVHSIVAAYSGDAANAASTSSAFSQVINTTPPPPTTNSLANGVPVTGISGAANTEQRYTLAVPAGASNLKFKISGGSGNASLYVRFGSPPTTTAYDCRSNSPGSNETCAFFFPKTGTYNVMLRSATAFAGVTLTATFK